MASAENSESGVNPERYRHCMREGPAHDESRPLGSFPEKAVRRLVIRKSGDLLKCVKILVPVYWSRCILFAEKRPRQSF